MIRSLVTAGIFLGAAGIASAQGALPVVQVLKQASCGCCGGWIAHMERAGFTVEVRDLSFEELAAAKEAIGLDEELWACHTAVIGDYAVEGHVPISDVMRLLEERPEAGGIAVPGMPTGSPGMEYGDERDPFDVFLVGRDGKATVWASYPGN